MKTKSFISLIALLLVGGLVYWIVRPKPTSVTTVRLIGEAYAPLEALTKLAGTFEKENNLKIEVSQKDHQSVVAELDQEMASGSVSYDLILMPHRLLGKLVEKNQVQPLDGLLTGPSSDLQAPADAFLRNWKEISWYKGKAYGAPFSVLTMYGVYRKDIMELPENQTSFKTKYGRDLAPPKTWKEYEELVAFFHRPDKGLNGTFVQGQQHVALWYEWLNVLYAFGADVLETDGVGSSYGPIIVNSPQAKLATEAYVRLLDYSPKESTNYNWDDALAVMQTGKCFMGMIWHDTTPYLEDPKQTPLAGKFGYFPLPSVDGKVIAQLEGWSYLVPKGAAHPKEAARFLEWAMTPNIQLEQVKNGGASPRQSVYQNKDVAALPFVAAYLKAVDVGKVKPTFPESAAITEALVMRLSEMVNKKVSVNEGLDKAAADLAKMLGGKATRKF
jgi:multiple sugar transport system substrate-binding protein